MRSHPQHLYLNLRRKKVGDGATLSKGSEKERNLLVTGGKEFCGLVLSVLCWVFVLNTTFTDIPTSGASYYRETMDGGMPNSPPSSEEEPRSSSRTR
jgi:hypothetical protein